MVIYLVYKLLYNSSDIFNILASNRNEHFNLASGGVYMDQVCRQTCGELLPRLFILTKTTQGYSGYFLLHFPSSCLDLPLASTLLCEARTFLKLTITLNLRPSDQADDYILTRILSLSIPFLQFFLISKIKNVVKH